MADAPQPAYLAADRLQRSHPAFRIPQLKLETGTDDRGPNNCRRLHTRVSIAMIVMSYCHCRLDSCGSEGAPRTGTGNWSWPSSRVTGCALHDALAFINLCGLHQQSVTKSRTSCLSTTSALNVFSHAISSENRACSVQHSEQRIWRV